MSKFTPGPWFVLGKNEDGYPLISGQPFYKGHPDPLYHVLVVSNGADDEAADADAKLIAAAPDLYAALKEAFIAFAHDDEGPVWADSTIAKARAALAKVDA